MLTQRKEERERNKVARGLLPIAKNQARMMSQRSGVNYFDLESEANYAIALAMGKRELGRQGFYKYVKLYIQGYLKNYLRDRARVVRLPRSLTTIYLAENRLYRNIPELRGNATLEELSVLLNCTVNQLRESREAANLSHVSTDAVSSLDGYTEPVTSETAAIDADLVSTVFTQGCRYVSNVSKVDIETVQLRFYGQLRLLLSNYAQEKE